MLAPAPEFAQRMRAARPPRNKFASRGSPHAPTGLGYAVLDALREIVGSAWLDEQLGDPAKLRVAFSGAGRRLGQDPVSAAGMPALGRDELGRIALLVAASADAETTRELFRRGDARERQAVLRALPLLAEPAAHLELAIDACRTNVVPVFEAIACDNPYPAREFPDAAFFQMVLKALFVGAPVARIVGLRERTTEELERMVEAFASERRAAGRPVPEDAKLIRRSP